MLITDAASDEEVLLEQNSARYAGIKLMRGMWEEGSYNSSGTFFPLALPDDGVMWSSAGHCLMPNAQRMRRWCVLQLFRAPRGRIQPLSQMGQDLQARDRKWLEGLPRKAPEV